MLQTFDLGTYMPYLALLAAFHFVDVLEVYLVARRSTAAPLAEPPSGMDPNKVKLLDRTVTRLREVLAEFGSPLQDSLAGDAVRPVDPVLVERIRQDLLAQKAGQ